MAPHAVKRRKLRDAEDDPSPERPEKASRDDEIISEASSDDESESAQAKVHTHPKPRSPFDVYAAHSNGDTSLFKLQLDELLAGIRPKYTRRGSTLESNLRTLKSLIEAIPDHGERTVSCSFPALSSSLTVA